MKKIIILISVIVITSCERKIEGYDSPRQIKVITVDGDTAVIYNDAYHEQIKIRKHK